MSVIALLFSLNAVACPAGAPAGFAPTPNEKERAYTNKAKTIQLVLKCDPRLTQSVQLDALKILGTLQQEGDVAFVDLKPGALRIYVAGDAQLSVVAKTPEALAKASPALIKYLQK